MNGAFQRNYLLRHVIFYIKFLYLKQNTPKCLTSPTGSFHKKNEAVLGRDGCSPHINPAFSRLYHPSGGRIVEDSHAFATPRTHNWRRTRPPPRSACKNTLAQSPSEIRVDYATYNPVSLLLKEKGYLRGRPGGRRDRGSCGVQSHGSNRALEFLNAGSLGFRLDRWCGIPDRGVSTAIRSTRSTVFLFPAGMDGARHAGGQRYRKRRGPRRQGDRSDARHGSAYLPRTGTRLRRSDRARCTPRPVCSTPTGASRWSAVTCRPGPGSIPMMAASELESGGASVLTAMQTPIAGAFSMCAQPLPRSIRSPPWSSFPPPPKKKAPPCHRRLMSAPGPKPWPIREAIQALFRDFTRFAGRRGPRAQFERTDLTHSAIGEAQREYHPARPASRSRKRASSARNVDVVSHLDALIVYALCACDHAVSFPPPAWGGGGKTRFDQERLRSASMALSNAITPPTETQDDCFGAPRRARRSFDLAAARAESGPGSRLALGARDRLGSRRWPTVFSRGG